jgi:hypothetical protein
MTQKMRSYYKSGGTRVRYDDRFETQLFPRVRCQLLAADWQLAEDQQHIADTLNTEFENAVHTSDNKEEVTNKMTAVIIKLHPQISLAGLGHVLERLVRATFAGL